jgi:hypothetical protein
LLASNRDGEVVAAARAIGRTLRAAGWDFHDFAEAIETPPPPELVPAAPWQRMARFCTARPECLNERELRFVRDMTGWRSTPSVAQQNWLVAIYERAWRQEHQT